MTLNLSKEEIVTVFKTILDHRDTANWDGIHRYIQPTVELENTILQRDAFIAQLHSATDDSRQQSKLGNYVVDVDSQVIAAEVLNSGNDESATGKNLGYREITFIWFANSLIFKFKSQRDGHSQTLESTPHPITSSQTVSSLDLKTYYHEYIATINAGTIGQNPEKFLSPTIIHNNRAIETTGFVGWMNGAHKAVQSLHYEIKHLVVDGQSGQVAACVEVSGLPVENWFGVEPNGKSVRFQEHAMYWVDKKQINKIITVLDLDSFRKQLQG
ncbi:hypothetical protein NCS52_01502800 [Fusarium sp. LHS14.1]|nr:hypothetical protein NCS52_01502800 [Fusarium sp. LHS14.1]